MKKVFVILVSAVYTLLIIGVTFSVEQCNRMEEMQRMAKNNVSCCSANNASEKSTCCKMHITDIKTSPNSCCPMKMPNKKDCCTTEIKIVKWNSDEQLFSNHKTKFFEKVIILQYKSINLDFDFCKPKVNTVFLDLPPPQKRTYQILQHQFTFYS